VAKLESEVATLISQVGSLQTAVGALQSAVSSIKTAVSLLQNSLASLQTTVANLGTTVTDLQGQNNWAVVTSSGGVARHSGSASVTGTKLATGSYDVQFNSDVTGCAYTATIGDSGKASSTPGFITVTGGSGTNNVQVQTFDKTGAAADSGFHLYVSCP
jgi:prophage DNA circulation protein